LPLRGPQHTALGEWRTDPRGKKHDNAQESGSSTRREYHAFRQQLRTVDSFKGMRSAGQNT